MVYLVRDRFDAAVVQHSLNLDRIEVGQADAFRQPQLHAFLHRFPSVDVIKVRQDELPVFLKREQCSSVLRHPEEETNKER